MNTPDFTPISLNDIASAVSRAQSIAAEVKAAEALALSADTIYQLNCAYLTPELVAAAESALATAEAIDQDAGGTSYSECIKVNRAMFDMRTNGATLDELDDYLARVERTLLS